MRDGPALAAGSREPSSAPGRRRPTGPASWAGSCSTWPGRGSCPTSGPPWDDNPAAFLRGLEATAEGCRWLLERWTELDNLLRREAIWTLADLYRSIRLQGKHPVDAVNDPGLNLQIQAWEILSPGAAVDFWVRCYNMTPREDPGFQGFMEWREIADKPADWDAVLGVIKDVVAGQIERLGEMVSLHEEIGAEEAFELADAASFDPGPVGEKLRRHQAAKSRELKQTLELFLKMQAAGAKRKPREGEAPAERSWHSATRDARPPGRRGSYARPEPRPPGRSGTSRPAACEPSGEAGAMPLGRSLALPRLAWKKSSRTNPIPGLSRRKDSSEAEESFRPRMARRTKNKRKRADVTVLTRAARARAGWIGRSRGPSGYGRRGSPGLRRNQEHRYASPGRRPSSCPVLEMVAASGLADEIRAIARSGRKTAAWPTRSSGDRKIGPEDERKPLTGQRKWLVEETYPRWTGFAWSRTKPIRGTIRFRWR